MDRQRQLKIDVMSARTAKLRAARLRDESQYIPRDDAVAHIQKSVAFIRGLAVELPRHLAPLLAGLDAPHQDAVADDFFRTVCNRIAGNLPPFHPASPQRSLPPADSRGV